MPGQRATHDNSQEIDERILIGGGAIWAQDRVAHCLASLFVCVFVCFRHGNPWLCFVRPVLIVSTSLCNYVDNQFRTALHALS